MVSYVCVTVDNCFEGPALFYFARSFPCSSTLLAVETMIETNCCLLRNGVQFIFFSRSVQRKTINFDVRIEEFEDAFQPTL